MGWWVEDKLTVGDEPIDRVIHTLNDVREEYRTEQGREPTHGEVARFMEIALRSVLDAMSDNARVDAKVKITSKPMKKQRVQVGDVFVIKLDKCHFGRIVLIDGSTLVEFYHQTADKPLPVRIVDCSAKNIKHHKWVFNVFFEDFRWKVIGNVPIPKDYAFPDVLYGMNETLHAKNIVGRPKFWKPTNKQIMKLHLEPHSIFPREVYEENLRAGREDPWPEMIKSLRDCGVKL